MVVITKRLVQEDIADGAPFEDKWTADADYLIKQILLSRHDGASFTASTVTFKINETPFTKDSILCSQVGSDMLTAIGWNQDLRKDWVFEFAGTNREGVTISLSITLVLEKR